MRGGLRSTTERPRSTIRSWWFLAGSLSVAACVAAGCASGPPVPDAPPPAQGDSAPSPSQGDIVPPPAQADPPASDALPSASGRTAPAQPASGAPVAPAAPIYSAAQADRGELAFDEVCAQCHTTSEFRGRTFRGNWGRRTVYSFFRTVRSTMPDDNPGGLDEQTYLDVVSYVMRMNGHDAGPEELSPDSPMRLVRMDPADASG